MRIGVLGGSFDPPHNGHLEMARAAQDSLKLDVVLFVPAFSQWQKTHVATAEIRAHMVGLAIAGHANWQLDLRELDRGSTTFTVETMNELREQYPDDDLFFIVGADAAAGLDSWQESARLATLCEFAVVRRPSFDVKVPAGFRFQVVDADTTNISSSEIRQWCATEDERLKTVLPEKVFDFISKTGLYR
ncbi:MAG: hypothetical protein RIS43_1025 [Actinomycetota bacterium]